MRLLLSILVFFLFVTQLKSQETKFDYKWEASEGLVMVNNGGTPGYDGGIYGGKFGFIDSTGKIIISLIYDNVSQFKDGICIVSKNKKYGAINKSGKTIIPIKYDMLREFNDGLAMVNVGLKFNSNGGHDVVEKEGKWGFINLQNKIVIPIIYTWAYPFSEGKAQVSLNNKIIYIDKNGKEIK